MNVPPVCRAPAATRSAMFTSAIAATMKNGSCLFMRARLSTKGKPATLRGSGARRERGALLHVRVELRRAPRAHVARGEPRRQPGAGRDRLGAVAFVADDVGESVVVLDRDGGRRI